MTQLVVKLLALAALLLAVRVAFMPFLKTEYEHRVEAFEKRPYSTVFVGSSRTKCAVIPGYFDQLLQVESGSSYNFGLDTGSMPTTLDWSAKLIDTNPSLKHIFIEISGTGAMTVEDRDEGALTDASNIRRISSRIDKAVLSIFRPVLPRDVPFFDHNRPLDQLGEPWRGDGRIPDSEIQASARRSRAVEEEPEVGGTSLAADYEARITSFLEYARSRGVTVHFFVPPQVPLQEEAESIATIYRFIPPANKVAVNRDGQIYSREYAADAWHLNQRGAFIFTQRLAGEFVKSGELP